MDDAEAERQGFKGAMHHVGSLVVNCPRCGTELTIPINAGVVSKDVEPGKIYVRTDADVADYWSHAFAHREGMI
jgi:hypothetical protein